MSFWEMMATGREGTWLYLVLVVPAFLFSLGMNALVKGRYKKFSSVRNSRGITGATAAEIILRANGIYNVQILRCSGELSDHYDPKNNTVNLSAGVYDSSSIAAVGIAAHEVGHACQHNKGYAPIKMRNAILPVANIASSLSIPLIILGFFLNFMGLVRIGIIAFLAIVLFQLITLPVEFNASRRAVRALTECNVLIDDELSGVKKVLSAAALTYVAAVAVSLAQLLRFILLARNRNR